MKVVRIAGHPVLVISLFLLLLISGESFGGFYVIYILLGLPHGVLHALLAVAGISVMLVGYKTYPKIFHLLKLLLYLVGNGLMIFALVTFFTVSRGYNDATFHQTVPLISFFIYGFCVLNNVWLSLSNFIKAAKGSGSELKVAS